VAGTARAPRGGAVRPRRLGPDVLAPAEAVARPVHLLDAARPGDPPLVSWSTVATPTLVLGRSAREPVPDAAALARHGVVLTRRRSGGGPVLWDAGLLSLDVVLPPGDPRATADVTAGYRWLGEAVAEGLGALGIAAEAVGLARARTLAARTDPVSIRAARACFGGVSPFEVLAPDGRKVAGLAQARRRTGTLLQCGVLLAADTDLLAELLEPDPEEQVLLAEALGRRMAGIGPVDAASVVAAVGRAVEARLEA
jgi:lipoate---protein ligase